MLPANEPKEYRFSGIAMNLNVQNLVEDGERKYDRLEFSIICWSDWHWDQLRKEWEENEFGKHPGFDGRAHASKRNASQVKYEREFWFDISEVFNRAPT